MNLTPAPGNAPNPESISPSPACGGGREGAAPESISPSPACGGGREGAAPESISPSPACGGGREGAAPHHAHTNALIHESSPYLLQHAHNPVNWHPWGSAAFDLARQNNKPIFLSIGYSTCYWCHVMERQSFENPEIATLMNEHFICIKVDREERPDVDDLYMTVVQLMTGRGGWPMSVFLTAPGTEGPDDPGLKPFYAGTYFPPQPAHGMPGFPQLIVGLSQAWTDRRRDILEQSRTMAQTVADHFQRHDVGGELSPRLVQHAANQLAQSYDPDHGGFGSAPKFPQPANLAFLLSVHLNNPNEQLAHALSHTLDRMARGGMFDQIAGGFHRYSTDEKWIVPHFEKMLYDNGQLLEVYLQAHEHLPPQADPTFFADVALAICEDALLHMTDPSGTFWSAQDAEVDTLEGGSYLWTPTQVRQAINDPELANLALVLYGVDQGPNFQDPHHADLPPSNVLHQPLPRHELARQLNLTLDQLRNRIRQINQLLLAARNQRKQPGTDDKTLVCWNGMMIGGLATAARIFHEPRYRLAARNAAQTVLQTMSDSHGGLLRSSRRGQAKIPAFLEDYAYFIHGLLQLHRDDPQGPWLTQAQRLMKQADQQFADGQGGYFDTLANQSDLWVRLRSIHDGAIPSGNSQMAHNLLDLFELTGDQNYFDQAAILLQAFAGSLARLGSNMAHMQHALLRALKTDASRFVSGSAPTENSNEPVGRRKPVLLAFEPDELDLSTGQAHLRIKLMIDPEYHLNGPQAGTTGLIPTTLQLLDAPGLRLTVNYPPTQSRRFLFAQEPLNVYQGSVILDATIHRDGPLPSNPKLVLQYQVCTDRSCLQPRVAEIPVQWRAESI